LGRRSLQSEEVAASQQVSYEGGASTRMHAWHGTSALRIALQQAGTVRYPSDTLTPMPHVAA